MKHSSVQVAWGACFVSLLALTLIAVRTCVNIEELNMQAGNFIPRTVNSAGFIPKWRVGLLSDVKKNLERDALQTRLDSHNLENGVLSEEEIQNILDELKCEQCVYSNGWVRCSCRRY